MPRMSGRKEGRQSFYVCGRCKFEQFYLVDEQPPIPCKDCGWAHGTRQPNDVPSEFKIDTSEY